MMCHSTPPLPASTSAPCTPRPCPGHASLESCACGGPAPQAPPLSAAAARTWLPRPGPCSARRGAQLSPAVRAHAGRQAHAFMHTHGAGACPCTRHVLVERRRPCAGTPHLPRCAISCVGHGSAHSAASAHGSPPHVVNESCAPCTSQPGKRAQAISVLGSHKLGRTDATALHAVPCYAMPLHASHACPLARHRPRTS